MKAADLAAFAFSGQKISRKKISRCRFSEKTGGGGVYALARGREVAVLGPWFSETPFFGAGLCVARHRPRGEERCLAANREDEAVAPGLG